MNNLEKLLKARQELDNTLKEVEVEQAKIQAEITAKKNSGWDKMFEDLYSLRKYSKLMDSGIRLYQSNEETLGFRILDDGIIVVSIEHFASNGNEIEAREETCFFEIKKEKPYKAKNNLYYDLMKYVVFAIENWDKTIKEIEKRLEKSMELEMKRKISNSEKKQIELENQLKAISK